MNMFLLYGCVLTYAVAEQLIESKRKFKE